MDLVLELADVAGKLVRREPRERARRDAVDDLAEPRAIFLDEVMHEQRDVLGPLAQRRQVQREHVDAVIEILAKPAACNELLELAIGRGDDPDVDAPILIVADPAELLRLQDSQQLRLQRQRQLADLVEEQRPGVRGGEQTLAIARRVRERTADVAEQLVLEQLLWNRRTVDDHERRVVARRRVVDRARDQLLAGAALAEDRDRDVGRGDHRDPIVELLDPRARADQHVALARPALVGAMSPVSHGRRETPSSATTIGAPIDVRRTAARRLADRVGTARDQDHARSRRSPRRARAPRPSPAVRLAVEQHDIERLTGRVCRAQLAGRRLARRPDDVARAFAEQVGD